MILNYNGLGESYFSFKQKLNISRNGLTIKNISDISRQYGFVAHTYRSIPSGNKEPLMVFISKNHFVVLEKIYKQTVEIVDPAIGRYVLTTEEFLKMYPKYFTRFESISSNIKQIKNDNIFYFLQFKEILSKFKSEIFYSILFAFLYQCLILVLPFFIKMVIDDKELFSTKKFSILLVTAIVFCLQAIFMFIKGLFLSSLQNRIHEELTNSFIKKLLRLSPITIRKLDKTDIIHRFNGMTIFSEMVSDRVVSVWLNLMILLFCFIVITRTSIWLGMFLIIIVILEILLFKLTAQKKEEKLGKEVLFQKKTLQEMFNISESLLLIKSKNSENTTFDRWSDISKNYYHASYLRSKYLAGINSINNSITSFTPVLVILYLFYIVKNNNTGDILLLYLLTTNFISPLNTILSSVDEIMYEFKYFERAVDIQRFKDEKQGGVKLSESNQIDIHISDLSFQYEMNSQKILKSIGFDILDGEFIAIIGKSGSGKSTLVKLLIGYLEANIGEITFNQYSMNEIDKKDFRTLISMVAQENSIIDGTIEENICLNRNIDKESLIDICRKVGIYEDIKKLPMSFQTPISKEHQGFSGGQLQRIVLARELVSHPKILILDEPTSALDVNTERIIQKSIEELNCTRILVTHRLNTIEKADKIILLNDGEILASGNHTQLYSENTSYRDLYNTYMNRYKEEGHV